MWFWIARDPHTGTVHLFERKPVRDGDMSLGKRPKLPFKLKQGHARKVKIQVTEVK